MILNITAGEKAMLKLLIRKPFDEWTDDEKAAHVSSMATLDLKLNPELHGLPS